MSVRPHADAGKGFETQSPRGATPPSNGGSWSIGNFVYERFIMTVWFSSTMLTGQRLGFAIPNLMVFRLSSPPKPQVVSRQSLGHWRGPRRLPLAYAGLLQAGLLGQRRRYDGSIFLANVGTMTVRDSLPAFNSDSRWRYFKGVLSNYRLDQTALG